MPGDVPLAFELVLLMFFRWCSDTESADTDDTEDASPQMGESAIAMAAAKKTTGGTPKKPAGAARTGSSAMGLNKKPAAKKTARAK